MMAIDLNDSMRRRAADAAQGGAASARAVSLDGRLEELRRIPT